MSDDELAAFYAARLDEEESAAKANAPADGEWVRVICDPVIGAFGGQTRDRNFARGRYIAAMSEPARVLREVEAGRKLLREYERLLERKSSHESHVRAEPHYTPFTRPGYPSAYDLQREGHFLEQAVPLVRELIEDRAAAWDDHPDYKAKWEP